MAFVRRVRTASGATAVQIAEYAGGRQRIVRHVGSAHTEAELGVLLRQASGLVEDPAQGVLEVGVEPAPRVTSLVQSAGEAVLFDADRHVSTGERTGPGQVVGTDSRVLFEALLAVFTALGFDAVGDEVFGDLVIARIVEPTSLLDTGGAAGSGPVPGELCDDETRLGAGRGREVP